MKQMLKNWIDGKWERVIWTYWETSNGLDRNSGGSTIAPTLSQAVTDAIVMAACRLHWDSIKVSDLALNPAFRIHRTIFDPRIDGNAMVINWTSEEQIYLSHYQQEIRSVANIIEKLNDGNYRFLKPRLPVGASIRYRDQEDLTKTISVPEAEIINPEDTTCQKEIHPVYEAFVDLDESFPIRKFLNTDIPDLTSNQVRDALTYHGSMMAALQDCKDYEITTYLADLRDLLGHLMVFANRPEAFPDDWSFNINLEKLDQIICDWIKMRQKVKQEYDDLWRLIETMGLRREPEASVTISEPISLEEFRKRFQHED